MRHRYISACILLAALLSGVCGQTLAAATCPHVKQEHACCRARVMRNNMSHKTKGDVQTSHAVERAKVAEVTASDRPVEGCDHCMGRSPRTPPAVSLREVARTSNQVREHAATVVASTSSGADSSFNAPVTTREHSPPEASADRRVLISVFRI